MTEEMTADIHRAENGFGYKIKFPTVGPWDTWALTLGGAQRRSKRKIRRYYRHKDRLHQVVHQVKVQR